MYYIYFDSGTTNSRGYLLKNDTVLESGIIPLGAKDVSISNDRQLLPAGLKKLYDKLLDQYDLTDEDISRIYASGMISSPFGLKEIPHQILPISVKEMGRAISVFSETQFFKRDIHIVPGIKTGSGKITEVNNTRGEEIEALGLIPIYSSKFTGKYVILFPGSHTHALLIDDVYIIDAHSSMGGELLSALASHTVLASEVDLWAPPSPQWIAEGCRLFKTYGLMRAIYVVHASSIFKTGTNQQRFSTLTGIITASVIESLRVKMSGTWDQTNKIIIAGNPQIASGYYTALQALMPKADTILVSQSINPSVEGLNALIKEGSHA